MRRQVSTVNITIGAIALLVVLIGLLTLLAWNVITDSALEEFRADQFQQVTTYAQQMQAALNQLEGDIATLSIRTEIQSEAVSRRSQAIELLSQKASEYPPGMIRSVSRFDYEGNPRYAWPEALNSTIADLQDPAEFAYAVPPNLVEMTREGVRVTSEVSIEFYPVSINDPVVGTILLVAPVDSILLNTEFLVFEIDLEVALASIFDDVTLGDTGQLWVMDASGRVQYSAKPSPTIDTIRQHYSVPDLTVIAEPQTSTYDNVGQGTRQATITRSRVLNEDFIVFLSTELSEARSGVGDSLIIIVAFSVVAMISVSSVGGAFVLRIRQEVRGREAETQRRQALRAQLEISRALNSTLDLPSVLQRILNELEALVFHDSASILLLEEQELHTAAYRGPDSSEHLDTVLSLEEALAAREVIARGYSVVINDTSNDDRWSSRTMDQDAAAWMGVPLRVREQMVGVLNINSSQTDHFTLQDVEIAETFADQASIALQNARLRDVEARQLEQELTIARGIQTSLLPDASPEIRELEVVTRSLSAQQVSGDFFQYFPLPDDRLLLVIGDVQGKGIPASLMMAVITTAMRDEATRHSSTADLMQALNERLYERMQRNNLNSALLLGIYNPRRQHIEITNAGMVQPYLRTTDEGKFDFVPVGGYPVGASETIRYTSKFMDMTPGSLIVMLSDGVIEAQNSDGDFFGFERLEEVLDDFPADISADEAIDRIMRAVRDHLGDLDPQDDTTIMVIRALEVSVLEHVPSLEPVYHESDLGEELPVEDPVATITIPGADGIVRRNVELFLPSQLGFEKVARGAIEAMAYELGYSLQQIEDIKTAVSEACMNAIEHGNEQDVTSPVSVMFSASPKSIEIRVSDTGKQILSVPLPPPGQSDENRGWGLYFIESLMDEFEVQHLPEGGNMLYMASHRQTELEEG